MHGYHERIVADVPVDARSVHDPATGTLLSGCRTRPLDQLTTGRMSAWLYARHAGWPATANPHLLINRSTVGGTGPVSRSFIQATLRRARVTGSPGHRPGSAR